MSQDVAILLDRLPEYKGNKRLVSRRQDTFDIIREILSMHDKTASHYDRIAHEHWAGGELATARHLFDFMRRNVPYKVEKTLTQTVKTPAAILSERLTFGNDCKHYASYIVGVGAALNRAGYPIKCFYRFGCYRDPKTGVLSTHPGHVFAVFVVDGHEIWIDPVPEIGGFNSRTIRPERKIDKMPRMKTHSSIGSLYEISGIENGARVARLHHGHMPHHHMPHHGGHWLEQYYGRASAHQVNGGGDEMGKSGKGKAKVKKFLKKVTHPHIKIQPGKLLKKVGASGPRNAYLALLKMNFDNLAVKIHEKSKKDPNVMKKLNAFWINVGGNTNKLSTAIYGGVNTHNKLHPHKKITGFADNDIYMSGYTNDYVAGMDDNMGFVAAAGAAALLAAAAPIIKAVSNVLKSLGISAHKTEADADNADLDAADAHNNATDSPGDGNADINPDGSVDHGNGVTTKVTTDPATGKQSITYDVADPTAGDQVVTKKKVKTSEEVDTDGDGETDATETTKTKTITKHGGAAAGGGFAEMLASVKDYVTDHKYWFMGGTGVIILGFIIYKISSRSKPKRRR